MGSDVIHLFKTSIIEYCNSLGLNITHNSIKIHQNSGDMCVHCGSLNENIKQSLFDMKDRNWQLPIDSITVTDSKIIFKLNRPSVFNSTFKLIFSHSSSFGTCHQHEHEVGNNNTQRRYCISALNPKLNRKRQVTPLALRSSIKLLPRIR